MNQLNNLYTLPTAPMGPRQAPYVDPHGSGTFYTPQAPWGQNPNPPMTTKDALQKANLYGVMASQLRDAIGKMRGDEGKMSLKERIGRMMVAGGSGMFEHASRPGASLGGSIGAGMSSAGRSAMADSDAERDKIQKRIDAMQTRAERLEEADIGEQVREGREARSDERSGMEWDRRYGIERKDALGDALRKAGVSERDDLRSATIKIFSEMKRAQAESIGGPQRTDQEMMREAEALASQIFGQGRTGALDQADSTVRGLSGALTDR